MFIATILNLTLKFVKCIMEITINSVEALNRILAKNLISLFI